MFFGQQGAGAMAHGWRQQTSDIRMSGMVGRGSGYGPGRRGAHFSPRRGSKDNGWWDRDFDDGRPRNPWKPVDVHASKAAVGDVEDWPIVGSSDMGQVGAEPKPVVERKERKPGMLHLPLNAVVSGDERSHSYSQALRTQIKTTSAKDADDEGEGEGSEFEGTEGKKRKKKKDATNTQEKPQAVKRSRQKLSFDFSSVMEELEKTEPQTATRKMALGGGITSAVSYPAPQAKPTMVRIAICHY
jgi:hypothetical protein